MSSFVLSTHLICNYSFLIIYFSENSHFVIQEKQSHKRKERQNEAGLHFPLGVTVLASDLALPSWDLEQTSPVFGKVSPQLQ